MNLGDFEKIAQVKEKSLEKEAIVGKLVTSLASSPMKALGAGLNTYFVASAPGSFNKALRQAKKTPVGTIGQTF